ncbi:MAG: D-amino-acid transaminase [Ignavibacteriaceae bacterium]|nr:D-amino-acid transaminase [Ignavibacteriaceae bacterium]MCW9098543.1 D-amino-acid transaminase [Ignavibacteriaceae bacterium]
MIVYFNNDFKLINEVSLSPFDRGFLFADGVYESIRTYNRKLFRYEDHLERLKRSLKETRIDFDNFNSIKNIIYDIIKKNNIEKESLVYLQITRGSAQQRTHSFPKEKTTPTLFISVKEFKEDNEEQSKGVKVILQEDVRWLRCDIKSTSLLPVVLANQKASEEDAAEAILVRDGMITEGTHTNFFAVKDETVFTAPKSRLILDGITRKVVLEFCEKFKMDFKEEFIDKDDLKNFTEFFITSTTKELTPVTMIDYWQINNGEPGKITKALQSVFKKVTEDHY